MPQQALDKPRFQWLQGTDLLIEPMLGEATRQALIDKGHNVAPLDSVTVAQFGGGQVIRVDPETGVLCGGSEPRKDGCAVGY
jgi:gamma-glutamyltranspeptidase/glutathione hydrolase